MIFIFLPRFPTWTSDYSNSKAIWWDLPLTRDQAASLSIKGMKKKYK